MILNFNHFLLSLIDPQAPLAYIDPNTGGMLFQLLAILFAAFSGILFFFSRQIKTAFARLRRSLRKSGEPADEPAKEELPADHPDKS
jgi:hypothetical protein